MPKKQQLLCEIVNVDYENQFSLRDYYYEIRDEKGVVVAEGVSSSQSWVKHDAGGYHTKTKFDEIYPHGWEVTFDF